MQLQPSKNPQDGDIQVAVNAVKVAQAEQIYLGEGDHGQLAEIGSTGNKTAHLILRGGNDGPNYDPEHIAKTTDLLREAGLSERLVIDTAHKNKNPGQMEPVIAVAQQVQMGHIAIKGVMVESNLIAGKQEFEVGVTNPNTLEPGKSITDACVDQTETESMFRLLVGAVMQRRIIVKASLEI